MAPSRRLTPRLTGPLAGRVQRHDSRPPRPISTLFLLALLLVTQPTPAADPPPALRQYPSDHYVLHTDLPEPEAREAQLRISRMADEYARRTAEFARPVTARLPFYLYKDLPGYTAAGGPPGTGGVFDGQKLMAVTLRRPDGTIAPSTWNLVQHEGFHQFAQAAVGPNLPTWADEGLAEYFGEAAFTGDGFTPGLIPQPRLERVRAMIRAGEHKSLRDLLDLGRADWNANVDQRNYDQAWAIVHFLTHAENGKWRPALAGYLRDVAKGDEAWPSYNRHLRPIPDFETRWRDWWNHLPDHPTADVYARATLATLTSFLARAHAAGQQFETFEAFAKTPAADLKQRPEDWLPPALFTSAIADSQSLRREGATFALGRSTIVMTLKGGARIAGQFRLTPAGRIATVEVTDAGGGPATNPASPARPATLPGGGLRR